MSTRVTQILEDLKNLNNDEGRKRYLAGCFLNEIYDSYVTQLRE